MDAVFYVLEVLYHGLAIIGGFFVLSMICTLVYDWHKSKVRKHDRDLEKES